MLLALFLFLPSFPSKPRFHFYDEAQRTLRAIGANQKSRECHVADRRDAREVESRDTLSRRWVWRVAPPAVHPEVKKGVCFGYRVPALAHS